MKRFESGANKRKKKLLREECIKRQTEALDKFLLLPSSESGNSLQSPGTSLPATSMSTAGPVEEPLPCSTPAFQPTVSECESQIIKTCDSGENETEDNMVLSDPGTWPQFVTGDLRGRIVEEGPKHIEKKDFPKDESNRHFTVTNYWRKLPNGEKVFRKWLVYSERKNAVFCFCCKLLSTGSSSQLVRLGFNNWQFLSKALKSHETSEDHMKNELSWADLSARLKQGTVIDAKAQALFQERVKYWRAVVERIIAIVQHLADRNLAFRGSTDQLYTLNNGNFLGQVELMAKFDPIMQRHTQAITDKTIQDHYLGVHVQNEIIQLLANGIRDEIKSRIRSAKYFALILDCTMDRSRTEQLTVVFRIVRVTDTEVIIEEHFVGFFVVSDTTGQGLTDRVTSILQELGVDICDMRGQSYDNGANMAGRHHGVQALLKRLCPRAFFSPCLAHSLNLLLCDSANSSVPALKFFGTLQRLYTFFSSSSKRWEDLKGVVPITVKPLCDTRWESKIEAVKVPRFHLQELSQALSSARDHCQDPIHFSEADSLLKELTSYSFVLSAIIWYDILFQVNASSKYLQSQSVDLEIGCRMLQNLKIYLQKYRENGFLDAITTGKGICETMDIAQTLPAERIRRRRRLFDYEGEDEPVIDPVDIFRTRFFLPLVDTALSAVSNRFQLLEEHSKLFGFMYKIGNLLTESCDLKSSCQTLATALTMEASQDVCAEDLAFELKMLSSMLPNKDFTPKETLSFIIAKKLADIFPNVFIALRILLTLPITVASAERSFSKLNLIKNYLRSSMAQDRLSALAIISIEKDISRGMDLTAMVDNFAAAKARRVPIAGLPSHRDS
jgi:hypothetical protein